MSWFAIGRFEARAGGWIPPDGRLARLLYWMGHLVGRRELPRELR